MSEETLTLEEMWGRAKILADIIEIIYDKIKWTDEDENKVKDELEGKVLAVQVVIMYSNGNRYMSLGAGTMDNHANAIKYSLREFSKNMMLKGMR